MEGETRSEETLAEVLEERNRLWDELQRLRAQDAELEHWRKRVEDIEGSLAWRVTAPLRLAKRAVSDPESALKALTRRVQDRRER